MKINNAQKLQSGTQVANLSGLKPVRIASWSTRGIRHSLVHLPGFQLWGIGTDDGILTSTTPPASRPSCQNPCQTPWRSASASKKKMALQLHRPQGQITARAGIFLPYYTIDLYALDNVALRVAAETNRFTLMVLLVEHGTDYEILPEFKGMKRRRVVEQLVARALAQEVGA